MTHYPKPTRELLSRILNGERVFINGNLEGMLRLVILGHGSVMVELCDKDGFALVNMGPFDNMTGSTINIEGISIKIEVEFDENFYTPDNLFDEWNW